MSGPKVQWIALTPTASNLEAALREWGATNGWVVAIDGRWLPSGPNRDAESENFEIGDFLGQILTQTKQRILPIADEQLVLAVVASACEELPSDSRLHASARFPGFHRRAVRVLRQLECSLLSSEHLSDLAGILPPYLSEKLRTLSWLKESVHQKIGALGLETIENRIHKILQSKSLPELPDLWLWIGSEYQPNLAALIRKLSESAKSVTVVLEALPGREQLTSGALKYAKVFEVQPSFTGITNALATHLFQESLPERLDLRVQIASAADPLAETEWAVRMALEELAEEKHPATVVLYGRQLKEYRPLLAAAANRLKLPVALSQQITLTDAGVTTYLLELLAAVKPGASQNLVQIAKSTYSGMNTADRLELKEMLAVPQWEGAEKSSTYAGRWLDWVLGLGKEIYKPISSPVDELLRFAIDILGDEFVVNPVKSQDATRDRDTAVVQAASEALKRELQIRALEGDTGLFADTMSGEEFVAFLERLWLSTVAHVPASGPGVRVTQDAASIGDCQTLVVLGMLEGIFPKRRSEDPILSDYERTQINALLTAEVQLEDSHTAARKEREEFLRLCSLPTQRIVFLYPQTDEEKDNVPAFYLEEVRRVAGSRLTQTDFARNLLTPPGEECIATSDQQLQQALRGERLPPQLPVLHDEKAVEKVLSQPEEGYRLADLRDAIVCSFQFAFHRQLHVVAPDEDAGASLSHLPHEARLMLAADEQEARSELEKALDAEVMRLTRRFSREQLQLLHAAGRRLIPEWIEREFRARRLWPKAEGSIQTNVVFGDPMLPDVLPLRGQAIKLKGNVSAIGKFGDYRIAIRYGARRGLIVDKFENMEAPYRLELGLLLLSLTAAGHPFVGAEIDGASGGRVLYLCPRPADVNIPSDLNAGMRVIAIDERKAFFEEVKELLARSLDGMRRGSVMPCAGDHCKVCSFGELCRSSQLFGEQLAIGEEELPADE